MTSQFRRYASTTSAAVALALVPVAALAHHPMGGTMPTTFWHGLLSGFGHPILGAEHFAFIVGIGLLAAATALGPMLPVAFVAAMCAGVGLHLMGLDVPAPELLVALSVLLIGIAVLRPRAGKGLLVEGGLFAAAGVLHGYALAEAVIGAEQGVIAAYLIGLVIVQSGIALAAYFGARLVIQRQGLADTAFVRIAGAVIAAAGVYFLAGASGVMA